MSVQLATNASVPGIYRALTIGDATSARTTKAVPAISTASAGVKMLGPVCPSVETTTTALTSENRFARTLTPAQQTINATSAWLMDTVERTSFATAPRGSVRKHAPGTLIL